MSLPFRPACLPLLLGSLPLQGPAQALALTRRYAGSLLAWPQLPQQSFREQSLVQSISGFPGLVIEPTRGHVYIDRTAAERGLDRLGMAYLTHDIGYAALADEAAVGLAELVRQRDGLRGVVAVKGQLLGPISLAMLLTDEHQRPLIYDSMFFEAIVQHLHLRAAWQEAQLANIIPATIICLDEPVLDVVGLPFIPIDWPLARAAIEDVLAGISGCRAVYCGGAVDLPQVLELAVDLLIANLQRGDATLIAARTPLAAYLERGGLFGLGVIPNDEEALAQVSADVVLERIETLLAGLAPAGITSAQLLSQAVITPSDTLGNLTPEAAERALQILAETSRLIRERYQLAERA